MKVFQKLLIFLFLLVSSVGDTYSLSTLADSEQRALVVSAETFANKSLNFFKTKIAKGSKDLAAFVDLNSDKLFRNFGQLFFYHFNKYRLDKLRANSNKIDSNAKKIKKGAYDNLVTLVGSNEKLKNAIEKQKEDIEAGLDRIATKMLTYLFNSTKSWFTKKVVKKDKPLELVKDEEVLSDESHIGNDNVDSSIIESIPATKDATDNDGGVQEIKEPVEPKKIPYLEALKSAIELALDKVENSDGKSTTSLASFYSFLGVICEKLKPIGGTFEIGIMKRLNALKEKVISDIVSNAEVGGVPVNVKYLISLKFLVTEYRKMVDSSFKSKMKKRMDNLLKLGYGRFIKKPVCLALKKGVSFVAKGFFALGTVGVVLVLARDKDTGRWKAFKIPFETVYSLIKKGLGIKEPISLELAEAYNNSPVGRINKVYDAISARLWGVLGYLDSPKK